MNEFDEIKIVQSIHHLLADRGYERTPTQIRKHAITFRRRLGCTFRQAYAAMEEELLNTNPRKEEW